ncbi:hypothetical protein TNIN_126391 [Trichonephila inaurata madagascariensis]|uniref:Uncharacterized protein n=1 Tax=Trichonephila inaurata madagascariensis TaxID=2747483 RepID=A0A8X7CKX2_9ARAC|nr:hypothetical protein TNIN_126391 [Trichonephila inaurata madagascariensis]
MDVENAPSEKTPKCVLESPLVSWCTRKAGNDILPRPRGGGCSSPFYRRGTTLIRHQRAKSRSALQPSSRSGHVEIWQRHIRPVAAVGVRHKFPTEHYFCIRASVPTNKIGVFEWNYDSTSGFEWTQ